MKTKKLVSILLILGVFLAYNIFCYALLNNNIKNNTMSPINSYLKVIYDLNDTSYKYLKATINSDNSINVYVKLNSQELKNKYYRFIFVNQDSKYQIIEVNQNIPAYIK